MKQFFKFMFASMLGFFITALILFFLCIGLLKSLVNITEKNLATISENTVLQMSLDKPVPERTSKNPFQAANFFSFKPEIILGLNDILKNIKKAGREDKIKGIYLELSDIPSGISTIEEIREALSEFKKTGKFIVCYGEVFSQNAYYLATVADEIYFNPKGMLSFKGLNAQVVFFKELLEKVAVDVQIVKHGRFKSAVEPFTNKKMSGANREQTQKLVNSIWNKMVSDISESRGLSVDKLNMLADNLAIKFPEDALKNKLVDKLYYKDEVLEELCLRLGLEENKKPKLISLAKYNNTALLEKNISQDKIAVIYAGGNIVNSENDEQVIGAQKISCAIREARNSKKVKAIVFRINSGGGDALASEIIRREINLAREEKPVIVSYGDMSASGGYWATCGATRIIANPTCLTGSIGVFGMFPNFQGLLNDKLGISVDNVNTNENSEFFNPTRPLTAFEREVLTAHIENTYDTFIEHVATDRGLRKSFVDSIGQGRVWSGADAIKIGLIDELGGLSRAIELAKELAALEDYKIWELPVQKDPFMQFMQELRGEASLSILEKELGRNYAYLKHIVALKDNSGIQARIPFELIIE